MEWDQEYTTKRDSKSKRGGSCWENKIQTEYFSLILLTSSCFRYMFFFNFTLSHIPQLDMRTTSSSLSSSPLRRWKWSRMNMLFMLSLSNSLPLSLSISWEKKTKHSSLKNSNERMVASYRLVKVVTSIHNRMYIYVVFLNIFQACIVTNYPQYPHSVSIHVQKTISPIYTVYIQIGRNCRCKN